MPRPPETRLRRFLMQSIMWVILGATIGVAALVDRQKSQKLEVKLGEPTKMEGGISIRLPRGWKEMDTPRGNETLIALEDTAFDRMISVQLDQLSISDLFVNRGRGTLQEQIPIGDGSGTLSRRIFEEEGILRYMATRVLPRGRVLTIVLETSATLSPQQLKGEKDLIKQIAASVKVEPDSSGSTPTSKPSEEVSPERLPV
jgi:hypothetical protein